MTTVIAWISYSDTGESPDLPRAMYMASDSRITWGSRVRRWDAGRKIFSPFKEPHIFEYWGDVVFPSLVLGQLVSAIDHGILAHRRSSQRRHINWLGIIIKAPKTAGSSAAHAADRALVASRDGIDRAALRYRN